jgi:elongation factor G
LRRAVQSRDVTPVYIGTAYRNKGVQPLLDAVVRYLPSPLDREISANAIDDPEKKLKLSPNPADPFVGMAFKIVEDPHGQLTFMRLFQGTIKKGEMYFNQRTGKKDRFSRIVRMHSNKREEIDSAEAGDIVAIMGVDCASGDTYAATNKYCSLERMFVPEPVIKKAIVPAQRVDSDKLSKALQRFRKEDPTFHVATDEETSETVISGMGELHLEIYVERIKREYGVECIVGAPKVSYREAPSQKADFNYKHKKQSGGSGQYAHIVGTMELLPDDAEETFVFEEEIVGGRIPKEYVPSVEKGFRNALGKGPLAEFPIVGVKAVLKDGSYHEVDSSDMAFQICAWGCFRETFLAMKPVLLEPVMKVEIEAPADFQGPIVGDLISRRGLITSTEINSNIVTILGEVPLAETFGYSTDLRSLTQGQGTFTMELAAYRRVPSSIQQDILADKKKGGKGQLVGAK